MVVNRRNLEERIKGNVPLLALAVDDSKDDLFILEFQLSRAGYSVITAENGLEGLRVALDILPDLIISDTNMDLLNGPQLIEKLLTEYPLQHPLGRNPFILGCSDQEYLIDGQFRDLTNNYNGISYNEIKTIEDVYSKILHVNFKNKKDISSYIKSGLLNSEVSEHISEQKNKQTILLVEDNLVTSTYLNALLEHHRYNVLTAKNSEEGFMKARNIHQYGIENYGILIDTDLEHELAGLYLAREIQVSRVSTGNPLMIGMSENTKRVISRQNASHHDISKHLPDGIELGEAYRQFGAIGAVNKSCPEKGITPYLESGKLRNHLDYHAQGYDLSRMNTTDSGMFKL